MLLIFPAAMARNSEIVQVCPLEPAICVEVSRAICTLPDEVGVPLKRMAMVNMPLTVAVSTILDVSPRRFKYDQLVGKVPGVPTTAPTMLLLRIWLATWLSRSKPLGKREAGS